jgi:hypothetical protein
VLVPQPVLLPPSDRLSLLLLLLPSQCCPLLLLLLPWMLLALAELLSVSQRVLASSMLLWLLLCGSYQPSQLLLSVLPQRPPVLVTPPKAH